MSLHVNASGNTASKFKSDPFFQVGATLYTFLHVSQSSHQALPEAFQYFYAQNK